MYECPKALKPLHLHKNFYCYFYFRFKLDYVTLGFIIADVKLSIPVKLVFLLTIAFIMIIAICHFMISRIFFIRISRRVAKKGNPIFTPTLVLLDSNG